MTEPCKYEKDIGYIKATIENLNVRINGSYDAIVQHVNDGHKWRAAVVGIAMTVVMNLIAFSFGYGILKKTVETNAYAIEDIKGNQKDLQKIITILERMEKG